MNAYNSLFEACMKERNLSKEDDDRLQTQAKVTNQNIDRALNLGSFLLGDDTRARLKQYGKEMSNASYTNENWTGYLIEHSIATRSCIEDMIGIARSELKVNQRNRSSHNFLGSAERKVLFRKQ